MLNASIIGRLMSESYEIIWHGRGGQGAVTAAKIFTEAAYYQGFKGVSAKPTYFSEDVERR